MVIWSQYKVTAYPQQICSVVREINKINDRELQLGISGSWHDDYKGMLIVIAECALKMSSTFFTRFCLRFHWWSALRSDRRRRDYYILSVGFSFTHELMC